MSTVVEQLANIFRGVDDRKVSWWKQRFRKHNRTPKQPKAFRPWQVRAWLFGGRIQESPLRRARRLGVKIQDLPALPGQLTVKDLQSLQSGKNDQTRQRERQAFRILSMKNVNENYGQEPRRARRRIALKLAQRAYREHRANPQDPDRSRMAA